MSSRQHGAAFNATRIARLEMIAWTAYYRREWLHVLAASYGLVREAFNLTFLGTLLGAWCVFRANVVWAPYPDNDPDRARQYMRRIYAMSQRRAKLGFDPAEAARLEVEWWRVHREAQHGDAGSTDALPEAVARLYAYIYGIDVESFRESGRLRVEAMDICDRWVAEGCEMHSALVPLMGNRLLRSYRSLHAAVAGGDHPRR
jgi:hypothetical protein